MIDQAAFPSQAAETEVEATIVRILEQDPELADRLRAAGVDELRTLTLGEFIDSLAVMAGVRRRHLRPIAAGGTLQGMRARLSCRELEVVRLITEGLSNKEISARLTLSDKTVKNHISHILAKLNLTARTQVAVMALRTGFV